MAYPSGHWVTSVTTALSMVDFPQCSPPPVVWEVKRSICNWISLELSSDHWNRSMQGALHHLSHNSIAGLLVWTSMNTVLSLLQFSDHTVDLNSGSHEFDRQINLVKDIDMSTFCSKYYSVLCSSPLHGLTLWYDLCSKLTVCPSQDSQATCQVKS